jgi:glutamine cyclotransferase
LAYSLINSNNQFTRDFLSPKNFTEERTFKISQENFNIENFKNVSKEYIDGKENYLKY